MGTFLKIAWLNIWRNKRRTIITFLAVAFSVGITIVSIAMADGSHDAMLEHAMELLTGFVQIHEKGFQDDPGIEKSFVIPPEMDRILKDSKHISAYTPRLQFGALAATRENSLGAFVIGINPETEARVTIIDNRIIEGKYLDNPDDSTCIIGDKMAKILRVKIGQDIVLLTQGIDGSTGAQRYNVVGIFNSGTLQMDRSMVFIPLNSARHLTLADDMVNSIAFKTDTPGDVKEVTLALRNKLDLNKYEVLDWKELMPELVQFVILDSIGGFIFLALLFVVVVFGVLSAVFSSVLERKHEFGILMALGTRPGQVITLVMLEGLTLTVLGVLIGLATGLAVSFYYADNPIQLPHSYESMMEYYGMENLIYFRIYPHRISISIIIILVLSLLFTYYPAWKASHLKPDQAIRNLKM